MKNLIFNISELCKLNKQLAYKVRNRQRIRKIEEEETNKFELAQNTKAIMAYFYKKTNVTLLTQVKGN